jgi:hypothetical protein
MRALAAPPLDQDATSSTPESLEQTSCQTAIMMATAIGACEANRIS